MAQSARDKKVMLIIKQRKKKAQAHKKKFGTPNIGDIVETKDGRVGRVTFVRHNIDEQPPFNAPQVKIRFDDSKPKFHNISSIKKVKK